MLFWTHRYDLLFKLLGLGGFIAILSLSGFDLDSLVPPGTEERVAGVARFATFFGCLAVAWALAWRPLLRPASTWLYVWRTFGVRPSWKDARTLSPLFSISLTEGLQWQPCTDVADLAVGERLAALHARAAALRSAQSVGFIARTRESSPLGRLLTVETYVAWSVVTLVGLAPIMLGAFFQLGPAAFLVGWTASSDGTYIPQLSFGLGLLVWVIATWVVAFAFDRALRTGTESAERAPTE
ncbi:MAG: hypothetical protein L0Y66_22135 [Myxococcaceae bacterium]|nr:hypothetical protein [Myxococcaceae bacterium]MCI0668901.1 hypothetical protein [Myxococcaceae bacterium]